MLSDLRSPYFWRGFQQGLTWPISWPMMWLLYGIGHLAWKVIDRAEDDEQAWRWYHHAAFHVYQFGMCKSVFWNDIGGFDVWKPCSEHDASDEPAR